MKYVRIVMRWLRLQKAEIKARSVTIRQVHTSHRMRALRRI